LKPERFIAGRYLFSGKETRWQAVNYIAVIASTGVMLTVAALFVILSAFSGLREFNLSLIDKTAPDLRILPAKKKFFSFDQNFRRLLDSLPSVMQAAPVVEEKALLRFEGKQDIIFIRGVDTGYVHILNPERILVSGRWPGPGEAALVAGQSMAAKLSLPVNDPFRPVEIIIPSRKTGLPGMTGLQTRPVVVAGIYQLTPDTEKKYAYMPADLWREMLMLSPEEVSYIDLRLEKGADVHRIKHLLQQQLGERFRIADKTELNRSILKMLNTENLFTYITGLLFLIIAVFNIVGSIVILILKKKQDRFVLGALGMSLKRIRKIFFLYGNMLILISGAIGLVLGIIIVGIQQQTGWIKVPGTYLPYPVRYRWGNLILVILTVLFLSVTASWLASKAVKEIKEKT